MTIRIANTSLVQQSNYVDVPYKAGEAEFKTSKTMLVTKGISPCIAIAITAQDRAGLMHVHPKADAARIRNAFKAMLEELGGNSKEAYMRGGFGHNHDPRMHSERVVKTVQSLLEEHSVQLNEEHDETLDKYDAAQGTALAINPIDKTVYRDVIAEQ